MLCPLWTGISKHWSFPYGWLSEYSSGSQISRSFVSCKSPIQSGLDDLQEKSSRSHPKMHKPSLETSLSSPHLLPIDSWFAQLYESCFAADSQAHLTARKRDGPKPESKASKKIIEGWDHSVLRKAHPCISAIPKVSLKPNSALSSSPEQDLNIGMGRG